MNKNKTRVIPLIFQPIIPVKKGLASSSESDQQVSEDIPMGYMLPNWLGQLRAETFDRRKYYDYFDTTERKKLLPIPDSVFVRSISREEE